jgi:hypothetical protein
MSQYGNSWMMRRYFEFGGNFSTLEDNVEFNTAALAKFIMEKHWRMPRQKNSKLYV